MGSGFNPAHNAILALIADIPPYPYDLTLVLLLLLYTWINQTRVQNDSVLQCMALRNHKNVNMS